MPAVYKHREDVIAVGRDMIDVLIAASGREPERRARFNLHREDDDLVHEMIVVHRRDSLVMPHRHWGKTESIHLIQGSLDLVIFDDEGTVTRTIRLGVLPWFPWVVRMNNARWHTMIFRDETTVVHETINGPFVPGQVDVPSWAPTPDKLASWIETLKEQIA